MFLFLFVSICSPTFYIIFQELKKSAKIKNIYNNKGIEKMAKIDWSNCIN